jgi:hypothetical protein
MVGSILGDSVVNLAGKYIGDGVGVNSALQNLTLSHSTTELADMVAKCLVCRLVYLWPDIVN